MHEYPPMLFHYKGKVRKSTKADGPERIAHEWWLEQAELRDYYCVEDEQGRRYWLFRSGHYANSQTPGWFIHGFFASWDTLNYRLLPISVFYAELPIRRN